MLAIIRATWCSIHNIPLFAFGMFVGGFFISQPNRIQSYLWFLPTLDVDDIAYLNISIRIIGQFILGWILAPIILHIWRFLLFS